MLQALHPVSATVSTASFTEGDQGRSVELTQPTGCLLFYPPEASNRLQLGADWPEVGKYLKKGKKNTQMCTYTRDMVVYVHVLCIYKQVSNKAKNMTHT